MSKRIIAAILFSLAAVSANADFNSLLRVVSSQPGLHRIWTPGFSLVRFGVRMTHAAGVHDIELAVFEGDSHFSQRDFEAILRTSSEHPMVQTHSNRTGETAVIWGHPIGRDLMELLVLAHDPNDQTVVVRTVVDGAMLARQMANPKHASRVAR
jgi:hypothetical protein